MNKLRWALDCGFWDLDMSTPTTIDGLARAVPGDPIPLGLSRGAMLSRPKQTDFLHRFILMPFVPSFSGSPDKGGDGFALQRVMTFSFGENWFTSLLGQFNLQKFVSSVQTSVEASESKPSPNFSLLKDIGQHLCDKSLYALGLCSEILISPDDTLLLSSEIYGEKKSPRHKAVFHHKFPRHNLTVEAMGPGLFVDKLGTYWDVPLLLAIDLASVSSDSGFSYHLCMQNNYGEPKQFDGDQIARLPSTLLPSTLLPGLCVKTAFSIKRSIDIWRSKAQKLKMVQPFDLFLSDPHVSVSGIIGTVVAASSGDNAVRSPGEDELQSFKGFSLRATRNKSSLYADLFASVSCTAQHGNFQKNFLDLTRFTALLDFPSISRFLSGAAVLTQDLLDSRTPNLEAVQAVCPNVSLSFQQQIAGPFSFRVDSRVTIDLKNRGWYAHLEESVFAIEYALQVLGSAKVVAWVSPKREEAMIELRFFEA